MVKNHNSATFLFDTQSGLRLKLSYIYYTKLMNCSAAFDTELSHHYLKT